MTKEEALSDFDKNKLKVTEKAVRGFVEDFVEIIKEAFSDGWDAAQNELAKPATNSTMDAIAALRDLVYALDNQSDNGKPIVQSIFTQCKIRRAKAVLQQHQ